LPVLFERDGRKRGQLIGRVPQGPWAHAEAAPELIGELAEVLIDDAGLNSLTGRLVADSRPAHRAAYPA
jgi:tRNA-2-methylthio-N6-dimethylallyladenosine synthase